MKYNTRFLIATMILVSIINVCRAVKFETLYEKQLKTTYGFEVLKHYHNEQFGNQTVKKFKGQSMLFMTPWRTSGIELSVRYINKFDYFVPCYYDFQKKRNPDQVYLKIAEQYSQQYLKRIKEANPKIKIMPRVYIGGMYGDVFYLASTNETHMQTFLDGIKLVYNNSLYDGIVFSTPFMTPNHKFPFSMKSFLKDIRKIADQNNKKLIIMMEGVDNSKTDSKVNKKKARQLIDLADKLIVTNYDYPKGNEGMVIPISPIDWIKENYQFYCEIYSSKKLVPKLIMAIPLYGYFVGLYGKYDPITGDQFLEKLKTQKNAWLHWQQKNQQCMIYLNKMQYLYFPCLHFYNTRLRYFEQLNVGVAAFEMGSGLEIFMQMF